MMRRIIVEILLQTDPLLMSVKKKMPNVQKIRIILQGFLKFSRARKETRNNEIEGL